MSNVDLLFYTRNLVRRCAALAAATYAERYLDGASNPTTNIVTRAEKFVNFLERGE